MFCCKFLYRKFLYNLNFEQIIFEKKYGFLLNEFFHTTNNFQPTKEATFILFYFIFSKTIIEETFDHKENEKTASENLKKK